MIVLPKLFVMFLWSTLSYAQYEVTEWTDRDKWMNPEQIMDWAGVVKGDEVADIGCHEGYFTIHLSKRVGEEGRVYGVDINADRIKTMQEIARARQLSNILAVVGKKDDPGLQESSLDVIFILDAYHEMESYSEILQHIKKALKPGGRLVILEKLKQHTKNWKRPEQAEAHTLAPHFVREELEEAGFIVGKQYNDIGNWENEVTKKMWLLTATLPSR